MDIRFVRRRLRKRHPLTISRGTSAGSENLFVFLEAEGCVGIGESAPSTVEEEGMIDVAQAMLEGLWPRLRELSISEGWAAARDAGLSMPALAALDVARWDWQARRAGLPLYRWFGLALPSTPTSVTVGIGPPDVVFERAREFLERTGARSLKVKLGSPEGVEADRNAFEAARQAAAEHGASVRVDANGGWDPSAAEGMLVWLAERGCEYVEQPLSAGTEADLDRLARRPLPIFVDESVHVSQDLPKIVGKVDGVNVKLMKTGGLTEAVRLVAAARAFGLSTMVGCMGESSVGIAAAASLGALFDHIDLDSHLNLDPDPAAGLALAEGVVLPPEAPGHGARLEDHADA